MFWTMNKEHDPMGPWYIVCTKKQHDWPSIMYKVSILSSFCTNSLESRLLLQGRRNYLGGRRRRLCPPHYYLPVGKLLCPIYLKSIWTDDSQTTVTRFCLFLTMLKQLLKKGWYFDTFENFLSMPYVMKVWIYPFVKKSQIMSILMSYSWYKYKP